MNMLNLSKVRRIKLGAGGSGIDKHCIDNGLLYIGFSSSDPIFFDLACRGGEDDWSRYKSLLLEYENTRPISVGARSGNATKAVNQVKEVFMEDGSALWITFYGGFLWHGSLRSDARPTPSDGLKGCLRPLVSGWSNCDVNGNLLKIEDLAGSFTKIQGYRATILPLNANLVQYLERRLNGHVPEFIDEIKNARSLMVKAVGDAIKSLQPKDFELLVEILFSRSWRRIGRAGGSLNFVDITFEDPMYPDRKIAVQVKSATSSEEIKQYLSMADVERYSQFYIVYHTLYNDLRSFESERLRLIDCNNLSNLVVDSGLTHWLTEKTK